MGGQPQFGLCLQIYLIFFCPYPLDFFPSSFRPLEAEWTASVPGDHGDHGTSASDEIDQKTKVDQNTWFFS